MVTENDVLQLESCREMLKVGQRSKILFIANHRLSKHKTGEKSFKCKGHILLVHDGKKVYCFAEASKLKRPILQRMW